MRRKSADLRLFWLLLISVSFYSQLLYCQPSLEWVNRFNGSANRFDIVTTMKVDNNSNAFVYGNANRTGAFSDIAAIKYSPSGAVIWQAFFNGYSSQLDECKDAFLDTDGTSYVTGFTSDTNQVVKIVTLKINPSGSILWQRVFLPPVYNLGFGLSITKDNQGNIYTCGSVRRANGTNSIVLLKYSAGGDFLGSTFFNKTATSSETPVTVCTDNAGAVYILASSNAVGGVNDILMLKYNSSLVLIWQSTFSGTAFGNDMPVKMLLTRDNKLAVTAAVYNSPGTLDYGIYRFDTSSALLMQYYYNGTGNDQDIPYDIASDSAGNVYVTGSSRNYDTLGSEDVYTIKINSNAVLVWGKRYNGTGRGLDYGTSVTVDNRGNVFIGGTTDKHDFHQQYALLKYSSVGALEWLEEYSVLEFSEDFVYTAIADNRGSIYVTGISFDSTTDYDIATIKYAEPIGIIPVSNEVPEEFKLYQNYLNPFNPVTKIKFDVKPKGISEKVNVNLRVFDVTGKVVAVLVNTELAPGTYEAEFNGSNYPSGVYFCKMENEGFNKSIKIMLLK